MVKTKVLCNHSFVSECSLCIGNFLITRNLPKRDRSTSVNQDSIWGQCARFLGSYIMIQRSELFIKYNYQTQTLNIMCKIVSNNLRFFIKKVARKLFCYCYAEPKPFSSTANIMLFDPLVSYFGVYEWKNRIQQNVEIEWVD